MAAACNAHGAPYVASLSPARFLPRTWEWAAARRAAERVYENYYELASAARSPAPRDGVAAEG